MQGKPFYCCCTVGTSSCCAYLCITTYCSNDPLGQICPNCTGTDGSGAKHTNATCGTDGLCQTNP